MEVLDLKVDDPRIDKLAREVDAGKKAAAAAKAKATANANTSRNRGAPRGRGNRSGSRNIYPSRDSYSNGGQYQYNNFASIITPRHYNTQFNNHQAPKIRR
jgi:hypothetical protein